MLGAVRLTSLITLRHTLNPAAFGMVMLPPVVPTMIDRLAFDKPTSRARSTTIVSTRPSHVMLAFLHGTVRPPEPTLDRGIYGKMKNSCPRCSDPLVPFLANDHHDADRHGSAARDANTDDNGSDSRGRV